MKPVKDCEIQSTSENDFIVVYLTQTQALVRLCVVKSETLSWQSTFVIHPRFRLCYENGDDVQLGDAE